MEHLFTKNFPVESKIVEKYNMIEENDKISICLSGGKDSITMLHAFKALQRFYPKKFDIIAISIKDVLSNLGKITGEEAGEEIINEIFSRFCLGK